MKKIRFMKKTAKQIKNKPSIKSLEKYILCVKDYPIKGVLFRDLTPILANSRIFTQVIDELYSRTANLKYDAILSPESRGFWFGLPLANKAQVSFVPVRKPNKLPRKVLSAKYTLEYGTNELQIHADALKPGARVLIVDDIIATGGTIKAIYNLVKQSKAQVVGIAALASLKALKGQEVIKKLGIKNTTWLIEF